jgi:hypothetical protein
MTYIHGKPGVRLFPAQQRLVDEWESHKPAGIISSQTGAGKTVVSCAIAAQYKRILIVCPAIVRNVWVDMFAKFGREAYSIRWGRDRKNLTKKDAQYRDLSYAADIQAVSYALVENVHPTDWDLIIFDEIHMLANYHTIANKHAEALRKANPQAHIIGLSATLMPTNAIQIWNPYRLVSQPKEWPRGAATNYGPPWNWIRKYVNLDVTEYGSVPGTPTPKQRADLQTSILPHTMHMSLQEIMPDMPALRVEMLNVDNGAKAYNDTVKEWATNPPDDVTHQLILVDRRAHAATLAHAYGGVVVDGGIAPDKRHDILAEAAAAPKALVVATYESLLTGVRILWPQRVLIAQFNASPGEMTQLFGRFRAVGTTKRPLVQVLIQPDSEIKADVLRERLEVATSIFGSGATEEQIDALFKNKEITVDDLRNALSQFNNFDASSWSDDEDKDD